MLKEFRDFALKGNVVDMAIGVIIGAAFGKIVNSLVTDILMPPLGFVIGNVDFSNLYWIIKEGTVPGPYHSIVEAQKVGAVTMNIGLFLNNVISFVIVAWAVFILIKGINRLQSRFGDFQLGPSKRECPQCCSQIAFKAKRCPNCTSVLES